MKRNILVVIILVIILLVGCCNNTQYDNQVQANNNNLEKLYVERHDNWTIGKFREVDTGKLFILWMGHIQELW